VHERVGQQHHAEWIAEVRWSWMSDALEPVRRLVPFFRMAVVEQVWPAIQGLDIVSVVV
jgi:hypothetical protein